MICLASLRTSCANVHKRLFSVVKINPSPTPSPLRAMKRLWIDCDAGVDDAQAIMLALAADNTEVVGISTVHGNVGASQVVTNVRRVLILCNRLDIPVHCGAEEPFFRPANEASFFHGVDGLGDVPHVYPTAEDVQGAMGRHQPSIQEQAAHVPGAAALAQAARAAPGTLTVLALGPLTNIALAIKMDATFLTNIHALVIMGGAETRGNVTPTAEYNFYCDPEAAHIVFQHCCAATATAKAAGEGKGKGEGKGEGHVNANMHGNVLKSVHNKPRVTLVSWECTERHALSWEWVEAWYTKPTRKAAFLRQTMLIGEAHLRESEACAAAIAGTKDTVTGWVVCDALAAAVAVCRGGIVATRHHMVSVAWQDPLTRGMAVFSDAVESDADGAVEVVETFDIKQFEALMAPLVDDSE